MTAPTRYLVQTRQYGEAWETRATCQAREQAEALADTLAGQLVQHAEVVPTSCPAFPYVRVTSRGAVLYDPRATRSVG